MDFWKGDWGSFVNNHCAIAGKPKRFSENGQGKPGMCVGMEASGHARWFERLMGELHFELWIGEATERQSRRARKQKTARQDAHHILDVLRENRFPQTWIPSWDNRDLRQVLWQRHGLVQMRTRVMNQRQAIALNEGLRGKQRLWRAHGRQELESFQLPPWTILIIGKVERFQCGKIAKVAMARRLAIRLYWMTYRVSEFEVVIMIVVAWKPSSHHRVSDFWKSKSLLGPALLSTGMPSTDCPR